MRSSSCANPLVTVQTIQASSKLFPDMAYERHLRDVLALHKPRNDFDVAATASTAGVVSANTGPFSRLRSAAGPAIRISLTSHCSAPNIRGRGGPCDRPDQNANAYFQ